MAGIEVAGLALGALPLLLKSVDAYLDGVDRFGIAFRKRKNVQSLSLALLTQRQHIEELIKYIALESGCEDVWELNDDPFAYLNKLEVQKQIQDFMGPTNTMVLVDSLKANDKTIRKVAKSISGLVPSKEGGTDDLMTIIEANKEEPDWLTDIAARVKLVLKINEIKAIIKDLDNVSNTLGNLSRVASSNSRAMASNFSGSSRQFAKKLRKIGNMVSDLYGAVSNGFSGKCHQRHEARLYLNDRIETVHQIVRRQNAVDKSKMMFDLVFHAQGDHGDILFYETIVQVLGDDEAEQSSETSTTAQVGTGRATVTFPEIQDPPTHPLRSKVAAIASICSTIMGASGLNPQPSFALLDNCRMGTFVNDEIDPTLTSGTQESHGECKSLGQILGGPTTALPVKPRMQLSLCIASSVLQLLHTPWVANAWSKDMVFFLVPKAPSDRNTQGQVNFSRPFITSNFDGSPDLPNHQSKVNFSRPFLIGNSGGIPALPTVRYPSASPKTTLLELGILLLEVWHGKTLEAQFGLHEGCTAALNKLVLAIGWLEDETNPMFGLYKEAVLYCLTGNIGKDLDWNDINHCGAIWDGAIKPLFHLCKSLL